MQLKVSIVGWIVDGELGCLNARFEEVQVL